MNKKGAISENLTGIVMALVVVGIIIGIGFMVLSSFMGQMTTGSDAAAGVNSTIQALKQIPTWLPTIVIVAVVGVLLYIVFAVLPTRQSAI